MNDQYKTAFPENVLRNSTYTIVFVLREVPTVRKEGGKSSWGGSSLVALLSISSQDHLLLLLSVRASLSMEGA